MIDGYKTIGEVSKQTGIPTREIKYYSETNIIKPSKKIIQGNKNLCLYSERDIVKIQQIALYRELGYSNDKIKKIITEPNFKWKEALDSQICELREHKKHIENRIIAAEFMRIYFQTENCKDYDISDFDNNIDSFVADAISLEGEENTEVALMKITGDVLSEISIQTLENIGKTLANFYERLMLIKEYNPRSDAVQNEFSSMLKDLINCLSEAGLLDNTYFSNDLLITLFSIRFISTLSIERMIDMLLQKENSLEFISLMLEEYKKRQRRKNNG